MRQAKRTGRPKAVPASSRAVTRAPPSGATSASISGNTRPSAPQSRSTASRRAGRGSCSPRAISCQTRSGTRWSASPDSTIRRMSARVSGATSKPKRAAKRATRRIRTGSSANASLTCRRIPRRRSSTPPWGSTSTPSSAAGDGVDGEVAPAQVLLERHVGRGVEDEAAVPGRGLALGAGERVLLVRLGMQEDREVGAHGAEPARGHLGRRGAHDDPVAVGHGTAEELVAHAAADRVDLHARGSRGAAHGRGGCA